MKNDDLALWLAEQLSQRGWSARELARRAGVSHTPVVRAVSGQAIPSWKICRKLAQALGVPEDTVLNLAGHRRKLAGEVEGEGDIVRLYRQLDPPVRNSILETMKNLLGIRTAPRHEVYGSAERNATYEAKSLRDRMAEQLARDFESMHPDDVQRVLDLMERLRGDRTVPDGEQAME